MEMNTRIQVEHRVSELCYAMRFVNPDDASDAFVVESLVEAMVLLAGPASKTRADSTASRLAGGEGQCDQ